MNLIRPHLKFEIVWADDHMLEFCLNVSSGRFSAQANFYVSLDEASVFAKKLEGFPLSATDTREYEFGQKDLEGYGGAKIRLCCRDGNGHLLVQVQVYMNPSNPQEVAESATVQFNTVPAEVDSFIDDLLRMKERVGRVALLQSAT